MGSTLVLARQSATGIRTPELITSMDVELLGTLRKWKRHILAKHLTLCSKLFIQQ